MTSISMFNCLKHGLTYDVSQCPYCTPAPRQDEPQPGSYLRKDPAGQWFYRNHAGTWQTCPPPFPPAPRQDEPDHGLYDEGYQAGKRVGIAQGKRLPRQHDEIAHDIINSLVADRLIARKGKDWAESDRIREDLAARRVVLKDNWDGSTTWSIASDTTPAPRQDNEIARLRAVHAELEQVARARADEIARLRAEIVDLRSRGGDEHVRRLRVETELAQLTDAAQAVADWRNLEKMWTAITALRAVLANLGKAKP